MSLRKPARIIFIGAPGVGKGTQTARLQKRYPQLSSISSGDILRDNIKDQTPLGVKVASTISAGQLVPDSLILSLIIHEFQKRGWSFPLHKKPSINSLCPSISGNTNSFVEHPSITDTVTSLKNSYDSSISFILDGFPRSLDQAQMLNELIPINFVVSLKTPISKIIERINGRWIHAPSGRTYNSTFKKPKVEGIDDITGERLTKREDDNIETWENRLKQFQKTSEPLLSYYAEKGLLWEVEGDSSDEITPKLFLEVEKRFGLSK
ncbi:GTP:AMP phosphotransferase, mitochondrial [Erysiphe necator]|uniref:GTP:AMP phosphotransferase, mitochondrial n=1 Tax=Uncinula necator TaxID=52586 RepID=A0A0B1PEI1_UNCNE|nr:GTP:AMP phosphotransferase, mitochondrial [Erysiphe necator]KHJ35281.1 putative adenylate kinase protein [Erysiphe necator]